MTADEFVSMVKFDERGLVPVVTQDISDNVVLMMAWADADALRSTFATGKASYWSRSRKSLWVKGETSGNFQEVDEVLYDCDVDTVLYRVRQKGPACHTGERTCFYRSAYQRGGR
jgi:phosphoribosyl-AMP cyclohydrolase